MTTGDSAACRPRPDRLLLTWPSDSESAGTDALEFRPKQERARLRRRHMLPVASKRPAAAARIAKASGPPREAGNALRGGGVVRPVRRLAPASSPIRSPGAKRRGDQSDRPDRGRRNARPEGKRALSGREARPLLANTRVRSSTPKTRGAVGSRCSRRPPSKRASSCQTSSIGKAIYRGRRCCRWPEAALSSGAEHCRLRGWITRLNSCGTLRRLCCRRSVASRARPSAQTRASSTLLLFRRVREG